jgi:hypothetical protein
MCPAEQIRQLHKTKAASDQRDHAKQDEKP